MGSRHGTDHRGRTKHRSKNRKTQRQNDQRSTAAGLGLKNIQVQFENDSTAPAAWLTTDPYADWPSNTFGPGEGGVVHVYATGVKFELSYPLGNHPLLELEVFNPGLGDPWVAMTDLTTGV